MSPVWRNHERCRAEAVGELTGAPATNAAEAIAKRTVKCMVVRSLGWLYSTVDVSARSGPPTCALCRRSYTEGAPSSGTCWPIHEASVSLPAAQHRATECSSSKMTTGIVKSALIPNVSRCILAFIHTPCANKKPREGADTTLLRKEGSCGAKGLDTRKL